MPANLKLYFLGISSSPQEHLDIGFFFGSRINQVEAIQYLDYVAGVRRWVAIFLSAYDAKIVARGGVVLLS